MAQSNTAIDPLDLLNAALTNEAQSYSDDADRSMGQAALANDVLEDQYQALVNKRDTVADPFPVQLEPKAKVSIGKLTPDSNIAVNNETGAVVYYSETNKYRKTDPHKVFAAESAVQERRDGSIDVESIIAKANTLKGDELRDHLTTSLLAIERAARERMKVLNEQASLESGYTSAQAAVQRNIQLDQQSPYAHLLGNGSAQTLQAITQVQAASVMRDRLLMNLGRTDGVLGTLQGGKDALLKLEQKRMNIELAQEARREEKAETRQQKAEELIEAVSPGRIANYRVLTGDQRPDADVAKTIAKERDPQKLELLGLNESNVWSMLAHPDPEVKEGARKLLLERQKAVDPNIEKDATETKITRWIKQVQDDPNKLIREVPLTKDRKSSLTDELNRLSGAKEKAAFYQRLFSELLPVYLEDQFMKDETRNVRKWKTGVFTEPVLADIVDKVLSVGGTQDAPIKSVARTFAARQIKLPDGKDMQLPEKIAMIEQGVREHFNTIPPNIILNKGAINTIRDGLINDIKNEMGRAYVQDRIRPFLSAGMWR